MAQVQISIRKMVPITLTMPRLVVKSTVDELSVFSRACMTYPFIVVSDGSIRFRFCSEIGCSRLSGTAFQGRYAQ